MILNVTHAEYIDEYRIFLTFNTGHSYSVDLKDILMKENRLIFQPLKDVSYFKTFTLRLNTIVWENEADFAPEFLLEIALEQKQTA